jgi:hypothetical protein
MYSLKTRFPEHRIALRVSLCSITSKLQNDNHFRRGTMRLVCASRMGLHDRVFACECVFIWLNVGRLDVTLVFTL